MRHGMENEKDENLCVEDGGASSVRDESKEGGERRTEREGEEGRCDREGVKE